MKYINEIAANQLVAKLKKTLQSKTLNIIKQRNMHVGQNIQLPSLQMMPALLLGGHKQANENKKNCSAKYAI